MYNFDFEFESCVFRAGRFHPLYSGLTGYGRRFWGDRGGGLALKSAVKNGVARECGKFMIRVSGQNDSLPDDSLLCLSDPYTFTNGYQGEGFNGEKVRDRTGKNLKGLINIIIGRYDNTQSNDAMMRMNSYGYRNLNFVVLSPNRHISGSNSVICAVRSGPSETARFLGLMVCLKNRLANQNKEKELPGKLKNVLETYASKWMRQKLGYTNSSRQLGVYENKHHRNRGRNRKSKHHDKKIRN